MSTTPDTPTREDYATRLVPIAARLVAAVHDEGPDAILHALTRARALPTPDDGTRVDDALPVILAAMVDPTRTPKQLLGWTATLGTGTAEVIIRRDGIHPSAVELALAGRLPRHALNTDEADEVRRILRTRGWTDDQITTHLDDHTGSHDSVGVAA